MQHRFHVVGLPHTALDGAYSCCAFTNKARRFAWMMKSLGHHVTLYAAASNDTPCDELVVCADHPMPPDQFSFDVSHEHWQHMNAKVIEAMRPRLQQRDFICLIGGTCQKPIADAFPQHMAVEYGIGYAGTFARYRVFESHAWMHSVYCQGRDAGQVDGGFFDDVIPNYFDVAEFPFSAQKDNYFLYIGRLTRRKGIQIAVDTCERIGARLVIAGLPGDFEPPASAEYVGPVSPERRGELMSRARAVFVPTQYIEPFGGVAVEAMLCGTPVITTDWGAFPEYVQNGFNGWRCRTLAEFCVAAARAGYVNREQIRLAAIERFDMRNVRHQYQTYFNRLSTLWGDGWYSR